jgi:hypothetical protein
MNAGSVLVFVNHEICPTYIAQSNSLLLVVHLLRYVSNAGDPLIRLTKVLGTRKIPSTVTINE